jgi:hypothetical protein
MGSSNLFGMLFSSSWATEKDSTPLGQWLTGRMLCPVLVELYQRAREALLERVQLNEELFQESGVFHHAGEWHTASMLWPSGSKMKAP